MNMINNYKTLDYKIKLLGFFLLSGLAAYLTEITIFSYNHFSVDRIVLLTMAFMFVSLHLIFNLNKMYDFMFHKRYLIAAVLFVFIVANGYHGSSISLYNDFVQSDVYVEDATPIFGMTRGIRGDEWRVMTPLTLSQAAEAVDFANDNPLMMAEVSNVNMFPQLPSRNISMLSNLFMTGFLFLNTEMGFSFYWFGRLFALFFASFELCMLLTKKNKLYSLLGAVLITFAPAVQWWYPLAILMYGQFAIVILDRYLKSVKWQMKTLYSFLLALAGSGYIMCVYPAWQVPFGYLFLGLVIWVLIDNKYKFKLVDLGYLLLSVLLMAGIIAPALINSMDVVNATMTTVYPGERFINGGYGWDRLLDYYNTLYFPYKLSPNSSEFSQFISFFPVPLLMAGWLTIKNKKTKKHDPLLIILILVSIFIGFWSFVKLPTIIAKITLLYMSFPERSNLIVGVACIYLLVHMMASYEKKQDADLKTNLIALALTLVCVAIGLYASNLVIPGYLSLKWSLVSGTVLGLPMFYLIKNQRSTNKYVAIYLIILLMGVGATVNPLIKGLSVIYDKPFAQEVRSISKAEPQARWLVVGEFMMMPNYMLANGAKVINSVNFYPNIELWEKIDPQNKYTDIYNRYANISVSLTRSATYFELPQPDLFVLNVNVDDLCVLNVNYMVTKEDVSSYVSATTGLTEVYNEDRLIIYKVDCSK